MMSAGWRIVLLAVISGGIALLAARILVPDIVPVGTSDEPQASWAVLTAFLLRAIELTSLWVAVIAFCVMLGQRIRLFMARHGFRPPS